MSEDQTNVTLPEESLSAPGGRCPICRESVVGALHRCPTCLVEYHERCFRSVNNRCQTPGCNAAVEAPRRATGIVQCAQHPEVETALRCSRCDKPICPKCLVQTPVGARCRDCARIVKSPIYSVSGAVFARATVAAVIGGVVMGLIWGFILLPFTFGYLSIFIGAGLGYGFTRAMEFVTGRKRGPVIVMLASMGIVIAWGVLLFFVPLRVAIYALVAVGVGIYLAYMNLR